MEPNEQDREFFILEQALAQDSTGRLEFVRRACGEDLALHARIADLLGRIERGEASHQVYRRLLPAMESAIGTASSDPVPESDVGGWTSLGKYRIERELGRGGQGVVFLAVDESLSRRVALKVLHPSAALDPATRQRFQREAGITSRLDHPNICVVYESGRERGIDYIAMRYVEGHSLMRRVAEQETLDLRELVPNAKDRDPVRAVAHLIEKIARALHVAHEAGIVHRDVKSGNILITPEGEPVILDFGLARETTPGTTLTASGDIVGTPTFMSPEQVSGPVRALDRRTDVWSLGVVLYQCLALRLPFEGPTIHQIMRRIREEDPIAVRHWNKNVPVDLAVITDTVLEKDLDRRYHTALAFAEDLRRFREHETILARPANTAERALRYARRHPIRALAGVLSTIVVALAASTLVLQSSLADTNEELRAHNDVFSARAMVDLEADVLWPVEPRIVELCDDWDRTLSELRSRRGGVLEVLSKLRANDTLAEPIDRLFLGVFEGHFELLDHLELLAPGVRDRRARAATLHQRSILNEAENWAIVLDSIAKSALYGGLAFEPILGLVPLGTNEKGYAEFWLVESGERPARTSAGGYTMTATAGIVLVLLPGVDFTIGTTNTPGPRFDPYHQMSEVIATVRIDPYLISKFEMTQGQWRRSMGVNPSGIRSPVADGGVAVDESHPVESVRWDQCITACGRLGLALPTEAQWENACRAGTDTVWSMGSDPMFVGNSGNFHGAEMVGWTSSAASAPPYRDGFVRHAPVGSFEPNGFGIHDMHGNVSEWCVDRYVRDVANLVPRPGDGRREPDEETQLRPTRGGSFIESPRASRSGGRFNAPIVSGGYNVGLRPIRHLESWTIQSR